MNPVGLLDSAYRTYRKISEALHEEYEGDVETAIRLWREATAEARLLAGELEERKLDAVSAADRSEG